MLYNARPQETVEVVLVKGVVNGVVGGGFSVDGLIMGGIRRIYYGDASASMSMIPSMRGDGRRGFYEGGYGGCGGCGVHFGRGLRVGV